MARIGTAFRIFFRVLGDDAAAGQARLILDGKAAFEAPKTSAQAAAPVVVAAPPVKIEPRRSDALNLLAVLQREARFVDFFKEDLSGYADDQIGKAARDVHRDTTGVLERLFAIRPVMDQSEGSSVDVPGGADAGRVRLTGNVTGQPPFRGTLQHAGWEATRVQLPEWTGAEASARVVAPAEVELK
jgi:hypothetical protein